jgi:hypothetical protein
MKTYKINQQTVDLVRHIFKARIQNAKSLHSRLAYRTALDLFDYALENRIDCLEQFDYYPLKEEE